MEDFSPEPSIEILDILQEWYSAHKAAEDNVSLIIQANSLGAAECTRVSKICGERMERVGKADEALLELFEIPADEYPPIVRLFLLADKDRGCPPCRYSSFRGRNHPECNRKITRWFGHRDALMAYLKHIFPNE